MLLLIGLGPRPPGSLQADARDALARAETIYLENYTNLGYTLEEFSAFLSRTVLPAPRSVVESSALLDEARRKSVALCVIGDIFTATTHSTIYLECLQNNIPIELYPNAGVMNTIAFTGLELYKFGQTISIPYPIGEYKPASYLKKIEDNQKLGLHTLCLLDIKADENRYMTIPEAIALLEGKVVMHTLVGVARLCAPDMRIRAGTPETLSATEWGAQPHCLVIPGNLNAVEEEFMEHWKQ
jgi:diphthine synthase